MQWRRGTFNRTCWVKGAPGPVETEGHVSELFGLARGAGGWWYVTHLPTGYAVPTAEFPRLADAKRFCEMIAERADWTFTSPNVLARQHRRYSKIVGGALIDMRAL